MACRSLIRRLAPAMAGLALLMLAGADDPKPTASGVKTLVLFDGKTLDGWKKADLYKSNEVTIQVEDGAIVLPVGSPMSGVTTTRADLPTLDYELSYEAKRISGGDFFAAATFPVGKSFITLVNGGWGGSVTGLSNLNGSNASENETNHYVKYTDGTWYKFQLRVTAKVIRCRVDAKEIFAVVHDGVQVGTRVENRSNHPLGFATYRTSGAVKNVVVRTLTPAEVAEVNDKVE